MTPYDLFISYRRDSGSFQARMLVESLRNLYPNIRLFIDVDELTSGRFDTSLKSHIAACSVVLLIVTPDALERCSRPGDWMYEELVCALENQRPIIPVFFDGAKIAGTLPDALRDLDKYNGVHYQREDHSGAIARIADFVGEHVSITKAQPAFSSTLAREAKARDCLEMATEQARTGNLEKLYAFAEQAYALKPSFHSAALAGISRALTLADNEDSKLRWQYLRQAERFSEAGTYRWLREIVDAVEAAERAGNAVERAKLEYGLAQLTSLLAGPAQRFRVLLRAPLTNELKQRRVFVAWVITIAVPALFILWFVGDAASEAFAAIMLLTGCSLYCLALLRAAAFMGARLAPVLRWMVEPVCRDRFSRWYAERLASVANTLMTRASVQSARSSTSDKMGPALHVVFALIGFLGLWQLTDASAWSDWVLVAFLIASVSAVLLTSAVGVLIVEFFLLLTAFAQWPLKIIVSEFDRLELARLMTSVVGASALLIVVYASIVGYGYLAFHSKLPLLQGLYLFALTTVGLVFIIGLPVAISRALMKSRAEALLKVSGIVERASLAYVSDGAQSTFEQLTATVQQQAAFKRVLVVRPSWLHIGSILVLTFIVAVIASIYVYAKFP